jgi:hypothetical protein
VTTSALAAAVEGAALAGADGVVAIVPERERPPSHPALIAAAQRSEDDGDDAAAALAAALGDEVLRAAAVAYLGCFSAGARPEALAAEIAAVARAAGAVLVVEPDRAAGAVRTSLSAVGLAADDHRLVPPDGGAAARVLRRFACRGPAALRPAPRRPLGVHISDHQGKSRAIADALVRCGQRIEPWPELADVVLIDHDVPFHGKLPLVEACVGAGGRAFLYPHGASAGLMSNWDGLYPVSPLLSGALVTAAGHAEVARRFDYPLPVHVIGWSLCEQAPRRPVAEPRRVVMAPTHGPYHGTEYRLRRNREVFERLLNAPVALTVRHLGPLERNGLRRVPGVTYVRGDAPGAPGMTEQIDAADAVVADPGTFANLAVARGATTVMWDSALCLDNAAVREPAHIDRYRELVRFPFEVGPDDLWETMRAAGRDVERVGSWRERFIGEPLEPDALLTALRGG